MRRSFFLILFLLALSFADEADKRADLLGTVQVSRVHSLDNAKGSYKSPRRAMFMSLLVPGSGQFYVGGQPRYIRGAFYLAEELALITGLYYHSVYKYDKQVEKYQKFADTYFDIEKYESAMNSFHPYDMDKFQRNYGSERENYCKAIYGGSDSRCVSFENGYDFYKSNYGKVVQLADPSAYYRTIASVNFVLGWQDAVPDPNITAHLKLDNPDYKQLGTSRNYDSYLSMRKKATDLADRQAIFLGAIILNHIVSAIDATLSAKAHNNSLYEEKVSFLDGIRLESDLHLGENFRTGAAVVYLF